MKRYFNVKTNYGIETIDEINKNDFKSTIEYINEKNRLIKEYHLSGINVYLSSRSTKDWKDKK